MVSDAVRFAVAAILFTAAVLKTHQLATEPILSPGMLNSRWFLIVVVQFELLLGFWLVSGLAVRCVWWVALATFSLFAFVAGAKAIAGESSCGCFGRLAMSPWRALSIDVSGVIALCFCARRRVTPRQASPAPDLVCTERVPCEFGTVSRLRWAHVCFIGVWLATATGSAFLARPIAGSEHLDGIGQRIGNSIIVEPERMLGRPFELGTYIDIGERLVRGRWVVILYRDGCPGCISLLEQLPGIAQEIRKRADIALVSVSPGASRATASLDGVACGVLAPNARWIVATPTILTTMNGRVMDVRSVLDSDSMLVALASGGAGDPSWPGTGNE